MDKKQFNKLMKVICKKERIQLFNVEIDAECIIANGKDTYIDHSYSAGDMIWVGLYEDEEKRQLSFFHELTHCIVPHKQFKNNYETEKFVWGNCYATAKKYGFTFSKKAKNWGRECLKSYKKYK